MEYWSIILLLAINCWHECPNEPVQGQIAVAQVLLNRSKQCGSTVEHELFRPEQFSWTNNRREDLVLRRRNNGDRAKFAQCLAVAVLAYTAPDLTGGANHYHADYIAVPRWAKDMTETAHIGAHIFYKGSFTCSGTRSDSVAGYDPSSLSRVRKAVTFDDMVIFSMAIAQKAIASSNECLLAIATSSPFAASSTACPEILAGAEQARGPP